MVITNRFGDKAKHDDADDHPEGRIDAVWDMTRCKRDITSTSVRVHVAAFGTVVI